MLPHLGRTNRNANVRNSENAQQTARARVAASAVEKCATSMAAVVLTLLMSATLLQAKEPDTGIPGAGELPEGESSSEPTPSEEPASEQTPEAEEGTPGDWLPGTFSGSVALTSNYIDRGISNTDNSPAIQGYLEYALETGLLGTSVYISTFGSNVKLVGDTDTAHLELDAFFGIRGEPGETGIEWDLGGAYNSYPGTSHRDNFNYWEIPLILTYDPLDWLEVRVSNLAAPEYQFNTGIGNYSNGLVTVTVPNPYVGLKAFGSVGYSTSTSCRAAPTGPWAPRPRSKAWISPSPTRIRNRHRAEACGGNNLCDAKVVFTVGAQF
jgi:uncharacterized protein (TIGR02001 family)